MGNKASIGLDIDIPDGSVFIEFDNMNKSVWRSNPAVIDIPSGNIVVILPAEYRLALTLPVQQRTIISVPGIIRGGFIHQIIVPGTYVIVKNVFPLDIRI